VLVGAAVLVAVLAVGGVAWARSGGSPAYRTAAVTRGSVTSTLNLVGTITPVQSAAVGFAQSGTVASVDVTAGQSVTAGQTLAQLDLTSLQNKLTQAQATAATARQTLAQAEAGQLPSGSGSGSGAATSGGSSTSTTTAGTTAALKTAQQAVVSAQQAADKAATTARSALSDAETACGTGGTSGSGAGGGGGGSGSGGSGSGGSGSGTPGSGSTADCLTAETSAMQAETDLSGKQTTLASAETALSQQLTKATSSTGGSGGSSSSTVSGTQLAQYQAAVDADDAAVGVAQQNLDQGTAVSPLSGSIVSVGFATGQSVTAASSTQVVVVSSPNGYEVDATVPTADIASVAVGQKASVTPDGSTGALAATVTSTSASATSSGFPVVLGFSGTSPALHQGASATVTVTTGSVANSVVVPTSAVRGLGTRHVVEVLNGSTLQSTVVTVGVTGPLQTQVLSGLTVGQQVVLADLSSTVTSDSSTSTTTRTGLTGGTGLGASTGLGGGGFAGGGGFGGGAGRPGG
jgi:multidrug efflux pump subunit AcrA (membrane-fusion protein)